MTAKISKQNLSSHLHNNTSVDWQLISAFCRGIVFTHGVGWVSGRAGDGEKVCPDCISETVRERKLILGRDIG